MHMHAFPRTGRLPQPDRAPCRTHLRVIAAKPAPRVGLVAHPSRRRYDVRPSRPPAARRVAFGLARRVPRVSSVNPILQSVLTEARTRGVFSSIEVLPDRLRCHAKDCPEPAWYELEGAADATGGTLVVRFATPDRWLSESIESDLMHFGDPLEELVEEELAELGWKGKVPTIRHFRDDAKLYTFENALPAAVIGDAALVAKFLFAYEAAFRALGDVGGGDED